MARTNRELCMLAEVFNPKRSRVAGMYLSEKLDGMRALWLPFTKGLPFTDIPFANKEKDKRQYVCTGLWSRYGKIVHCPPWFTEGWPNYPLDGELYIGRGKFQETMSIVKELEPSVDWRMVKYMVFDSPNYAQIFASGRINNTNYKHTMKTDDYTRFALENRPVLFFDAAYRIMEQQLPQTDYLKLHYQRLLPFSTDPAKEILYNELESISDQGGEGLMLRHPASEWEPIRSEYLTKIKKLHDAEATIVDFKSGQGKYLGMLGSLVVNFNGIIFDLSGFTDEERLLTTDDGLRFPGTLLDNSIANPSRFFTRGQTVTFRYRELSDDGVPKEARYLRKHHE